MNITKKLACMAGLLLACNVLMIAQERVVFADINRPIVHVLLRTVVLPTAAWQRALAASHGNQHVLGSMVANDHDYTTQTSSITTADRRSATISMLSSVAADGRSMTISTGSSVPYSARMSSGPSKVVPQLISVGQTITVLPTLAADKIVTTIVKIEDVEVSKAPAAAGLPQATAITSVPFAAKGRIREAMLLNQRPVGTAGVVTLYVLIVTL